MLEVLFLYCCSAGSIHHREMGSKYNYTSIASYREMWTDHVELLLIIPLCSDDFEQNVIISRRHARIIHCEKSNTHSIRDDSMNGVFVNDTKIDGSTVLNEGDCVTFGHTAGPDSRFQIAYIKCFKQFMALNGLFCADVPLIGCLHEAIVTAIVVAIVAATIACTEYTRRSSRRSSPVSEYTRRRSPLRSPVRSPVRSPLRLPVRSPVGRHYDRRYANHVNRK